MLCNSVIFCVIPCNFVIVTCQLFFVVFVLFFCLCFWPCMAISTGLHTCENFTTRKLTWLWGHLLGLCNVKHKGSIVVLVFVIDF